MRFQLLAARAALAGLVAALLLAGAAIGGVRLDQFGFATGQAIMVPATLLAVAALAAGLLWLNAAISHNNGTGKRVGLVALAGTLLFLYPVASYEWQGLMGLPIADVTSAPDDPPPFVALARLRQPGQNPVAFDGQRKIRQDGEDVTVSYALHVYKNGLITQPHTKLLPNSKDPKATVFWRCFEIVKALGWQIVDYSAKDGRIEAVARSFWFGQPADVVVRVRAAGFMGARHDVRAQSREGQNDHGFTLGLVKAFKAKADKS